MSKGFNKRACFIFSLFYLTFLAASAEAQEAKKGNAYLSVSSETGSSFVLVDRDTTTLQKVSEGDLIALPAGHHTITVIPQFALAFTFEEDFHPDTYHVAELSFNVSANEQSTSYTRLEKGENSEGLNAAFFSGEIDGTISFERYSREDYHNYIDRERSRKYRNTYLKVTSNADSLFIQTGHSPRPLYRIASGDSILIEPGFHPVRLSHQYGREFATHELFDVGEITVIDHTFELNGPTLETLADNFATKAYYGANFIVVSDDDSEIYINGQKKGTGAVQLSLEPGLVDLSIKNPETGTSERTIENLPAENARVIGAYSKPGRLSAYALAIIPGASQRYKNQKLKSALIGGGFLVLGAVTIKSLRNYESRLDEFNHMEWQYRKANNEQLALEYGNSLDQQEQKLSELRKRHTLFVSATALLYAFNLFDAIVSTPKSGYRSSTNLKLFLKPQVFQNNSYSSLSLNYDF